MNLKKIAVACTSAMVMLSLTPSSQAGIGVFESGGTTQVVKEELDKLDTNVSKDIKGKQTAYVGYINDSTAKIVEAIRIATAQESLSSSQISDGDRKAKQLLVSAMIADTQSEEAMKAMADFSMTMGQGYAACKVLVENTQLGQVMDTVKYQAANKVTETDNSPTAIASSIETGYDQRTKMHNDNFCTESEANRKVCDKASDDMEGADSNASTLFVSAPKDSKISLAKQAVRQNILGSPTVAIPRNVTGSAAGQAYLYSTNQKTALSAFPAYSLAYLESMSETREDLKDADGNPQSPNDMLFNTVARYYGGADSEEWQKSMIAQRPRGLLVELAKMEGLGAWMDYQEYLAMQRMEGNMAALTLSSALPMEEKLDKQRARSVRQAIHENLVR